MSDTSFGQVKASNTRFADDALGGFNHQGYNWQGSVSVQQELRPGVALNVAYFRTPARASSRTYARHPLFTTRMPRCYTAHLVIWLSRSSVSFNH